MTYYIKLYYSYCIHHLKAEAVLYYIHIQDRVAHLPRHAHPAAGPLHARHHHPGRGVVLYYIILYYIILYYNYIIQDRVANLPRHTHPAAPCRSICCITMLYYKVLQLCTIPFFPSFFSPASCSRTAAPMQIDVL